MNHMKFSLSFFYSQHFPISSFFLHLSLPPQLLLCLLILSSSLVYFHPLLSFLTCCDDRYEAWISFQNFRKPLSLPLKSPVIRGVLQRRMMGNYSGLEICFTNLASPPSSSLFPLESSVSEFLFFCLYFFISLFHEL